MGEDHVQALERPSLYDRLGGVYNVATVVDDLIDRVMTDPRLNANPRVDEAHHRVSSAGFKFLVTEMVCWAAGGPQQYSGRPMGDSHRHLMITPGEWESFMDDLQQTLEKFTVPQPEQQELKAIVESTREAIVIAERCTCARPHRNAPPRFRIAALMIATRDISAFSIP
jgi:hemoglobin